jgi:hypothetical protein
LASRRVRCACAGGRSLGCRGVGELTGGTT